ncbi:hypothetical protein [Spirulina subsalsa]|nr:hypothetical protein [Spirulina subsalsa]
MTKIARDARKPSSLKGELGRLAGFNRSPDFMVGSAEYPSKRC